MSEWSRQELRIRLGRRNLPRWLFWVLWDWAIIAGCLYAIGSLAHWWIWIPAILVIGTRQHALAILGHDGTHWLACTNKPLNDLLSNIFCFLPLGANIHSYRLVHLQHHSKLGTPDDPELGFKNEMEPDWNLPTNWLGLVVGFLKDLLGFGWKDVLSIMKSMPIRRIRDVLYVTAFWIPALVLIAWTSTWWILAAWMLALFLPNWAVFRLRIWSEHIGTNGTHRLTARWWQRWLFMPHNTWMHYEHHHWPWVPFFLLPEARPVIKGEEVRSFEGLVEAFASGEDLTQGRTAPAEAAEGGTRDSKTRELV